MPFQNEDLHRAGFGIRNPILRNPRASILSGLFRAFGTLGAGRRYLHHQIGWSEELFRDPVCMPSTHEEDVRLADLVGPEANRQGGDVYLTQVLLIYEGTELNVELLEPWSAAW